jgi:hypothetical protein
VIPMGKENAGPLLHHRHRHQHHPHRPRLSVPLLPSLLIADCDPHNTSSFAIK